MSTLSDRLASLPPNHRAALEWFNVRRGSDISKPEAIGGVHVFNPQTGIQKPKGWVHAVSVRQTLINAYDDRVPNVAPDGSWTYRYSQERVDPAEAASIATNRALIANQDDDVPVAVMIQVKIKPRVRYHVWGLARVIGFSDGYFYLRGYNDQGELPLADFTYPTTPYQLVPVAEPTAPLSFEDARRRIEAQIVTRQGGEAFRNDALKRFNGRCAISGWAVVQVLEAAHIVPYLGDHTNTPENALLLRADLHTLFDRQLLSVDPDTLRVSIAPSLTGTPYAEFEGTAVAAPSGINLQHFKARFQERASWMAHLTYVA